MACHQNLNFRMLCLQIFVHLLLIYNVPLNAELTRSSFQRVKEVIAGDNIEIECYFNTFSSNVNFVWEHVKAGDSFVNGVFIGVIPISKYADRYSLSSSDNYNLVIRNVQSGDAGTYLCHNQKDSQRYQNTSTELVVLETPLVCSSNQSGEGVLVENSCGITPDNIQLSCSVRYSGNVQPALTWKEMKESDNNNTLQGNKVSNSIITQAKWKKSGIVFTCQTRLLNQPCYIVVDKSLYVVNSTMEVTINLPQEISCSANVSQDLPCKYKWLRENIQVADAQKLILTQESSTGDYRCLADCDIRGTSCVVLSLLVHYDHVVGYCNAKDSLVTSIVITAVATVAITLLVLMLINLKFDLSSSIRRSVLRKSVEKRFDRSSSAEHRNGISLPLLGLKSELAPTFIEEVSTPGFIKGVAVFELKIYIVRFGSKNIEEYNLEALKDYFVIPVLNLKQPRDLVSCVHNKCLYVSDTNHAVHKLSLKTMVAKKWTTTGEPEGLSVTNNKSVIVVFAKERLVTEFDSDGNVIRDIHLPGDIFKPCHAVLLNDGNFLICHSAKNKPNRICLMTAEGALINSYSGTGIFATETEMWPTRLVLMKSGCVFVVTHQKILRVNLTLTTQEVYIGIDNHFPSRICLDEEHGRMYVTENERNGRILIFDLNCNNNESQHQT